MANRALTLLLALLAAIGTGQTGPSQGAPGRAIVATRLSGTPATRLLEVDLGTGAITTLGRFPSDTWPPLAVREDPVNGDLLLAVDAGGRTHLLRLARSGAVLVNERLLAVLQAPVTDLALTTGGRAHAALDGASGGVVGLPRNGGNPAVTLAWPRVAALAALDYTFEAAWAAQAGTAGADPQLQMIDLPTGQPLFGPGVLSGVPAGVTGVVDVPTAVPRAVVSTDAGTLWLVSPLVPQVPLAVTPVLPPGATADLEATGAFELLALGGSAHPFVSATSLFTQPMTWRTVAGPLPGDPVAFDVCGPALAQVVLFGPSCPGPTPSLVQGAGGPPALGNAGFHLTLLARPTAPVVFVLGTSDQRYLGQPLPLPIPGGCELLVSPELLLGGVTDPLGRASLALPIPALPALAGAIVFAQGLQLGAVGLDASPGAAVQIRS